MTDTTNLLDADGDQIVAAWFTNYTDSPPNALRRLRDEIVRQAREGMVDVWHLDVANDALATLRAENARLRAELATAKHTIGNAQSYTIGMQKLLEDLAAGRPLRTEGVENTHVLDKARRVVEAMATAKREGAREALEKLAERYAKHWRDGAELKLELGVSHTLDFIFGFLSREYPAPAVADTGPEDVVAPLEFDHAMSDEWLPSAYERIRITPDLARRIVAMGGGK